MTQSPLLLRRRAPSRRAHGKLPSTDILVLCFLAVEVCFFSWKNVAQPLFDILPSPLVHGVQSLSSKQLSARSPGTTADEVPYKIHRPRSLPCGTPVERKWKSLQNEPLDSGLLFMNLVHSDDPIFGSVALQIADPLSCASRTGTMTKTANQIGYGSRNNETTHLFTVLRSPTERAIRDFFHHMVTLRKYEPSDTEFQTFLDERGYQNRNLEELSLREYRPSGRNHDDDEEVVNSILQGYDFIGISERRDETLVVMKLLWGLKTSQILHVQDPTPFAFEDERCFVIAQPFVSPSMREYFSRQEWQDRISGDTLLYRAANRSLDKTIAHLGKSFVEKELKSYRASLQYVKEMCQHNTTFLCNYNGMWQRRNACQYAQYGCASKCLSSQEIVERVDR